MELYQKYEKHGLEILAFPCNQFGKQEPFKDPEIKEKTIERWGIQFPMFHKTKVNGKETDEVFKFLRSNTPIFVDKS